MNILYSPSEPYQIRNDLGDYGISSPNLPVDYGWYVRAVKSLTERKHWPGDLLSSMSDGRLNREVQALLENIEKGGKSYLLLEGHLECDAHSFILNPYKPSGWTIDNVSERIASIQAMGVELLLSPSIKETALILVSQYRWELKDDHKSIYTRPGPEREAWGQRSYSNYILWFYQGIPGVGRDIAEILYAIAPTCESLCALSVQDLMGLKNFGKKRSERVYRFIHEGKL